MREIVTGLPVFPQIIEAGDIIYVDKTEYVYRMIRSRERFFFISRPRRFGKSLMCSTLDALFSGKKELFEGLWIGTTDYDFRAYPVLHFDFSTPSTDTYEDFLNGFRMQLHANAARYGKTLSDMKPAEMMKELLSSLMSPVIIIDEFDSAIIDAASRGKTELAENMRVTFNSFYKVIKSHTGNIRFLFITGCTKLSGLSIFSAMNNLNDISADPDYAGMFGYTEEELLENFGEHIEQKLALPACTYKGKDEFLSALRSYYDGYRFSAESGLKVYNPVSIGKYFLSSSLVFNNYWIMTGGLSTLSVMLARNTDLLSIMDERIRIAKEDLTSFDISQVSSWDAPGSAVEALLYYAGYLTLTGSDDFTFTLDFPNTEVRTTFLSSLVRLYTLRKVNPRPVVMEALTAARAGDHGRIVSSVNKYYRLFNYKDTEGYKELLVRFAFKAFFGMLNIALYTELPGGMGRLDAVMMTETNNYVFEFKVDGKSADDAMEQIINTHYDWFFTGDQKPLHLIGLDFRTDKRQIIAYTHMLHGSGEIERYVVPETEY